MKSLLLTALVAVLLFTAPAYAGNASESQAAKTPTVSSSCDMRGPVYGQGCCSWHGANAVVRMDGIFAVTVLSARRAPAIARALLCREKSGRFNLLSNG
jgi:hypothetical protein